MKWHLFETYLVKTTEKFLTFLKKRKLKKQKAQRFFLLEWIISFLTIIVLVIFINMFLFQNYRIPSGSMIPELQEGDLIFVEKISFGPEVLPGTLKLPALRLPRRGEVVSFESEVYACHGPLAELFYRFVYFITLANVNLRTDANNEVLVDLLIKRVIGLPGDFIREKDGEFEIKPAAEDVWYPEEILLQDNNVSYAINDQSFRQGRPFYRQPLEDLAAWLGRQLREDIFAFPLPAVIAENDPSDYLALSRLAKEELGYYVPTDSFFPMGDNRPNSNDARYFGPVKLSRIQGKALFRFFPFNRLDIIH